MCSYISSKLLRAKTVLLFITVSPSSLTGAGVTSLIHCHLIMIKWTKKTFKFEGWADFCEEKEIGNMVRKMCKGIEEM